MAVEFFLKGGSPLAYFKLIIPGVPISAVSHHPWVVSHAEEVVYVIVDGFLAHHPRGAHFRCELFP